PERERAQLVLVGRVQPGATEFDRQPTRVARRPGASAHPVARFDDADCRSCRREPPRRPKPCGTGPDDDDFRISHRLNADPVPIGLTVTPRDDKKPIVVSRAGQYYKTQDVVAGRPHPPLGVGSSLETLSLPPAAAGSRRVG